MKELFTKKNILIGIAVIVAIPVVAGIGVRAYDQIDRYFYAQSKKPALELGKDYETLAKSIHSSLKNKNRENAYALHCMDGGNGLEERRRKERVFNEFWEQAKDEDYSESIVRLEDYGGKRSPDIYIDKIKADDGDTFTRSFDAGGASTHKCASFTAFYSYEEKAYYHEVKMRKYENSQTNN